MTEKSALVLSFIHTTPTSLFYAMVVGTDEVKSSSKHLFVQRQQQQYKEKVRNIFKVNNKDIRTTPLM